MSPFKSIKQVHQNGKSIKMEFRMHRNIEPRRNWILGAGLGLVLAMGAGSQGAIALPVLLSSDEIARQMQDLSDWALAGREISCTYSFGNFVEAIAFVNRLVEPAEAAAHHPDLTIAYNRVTLRLTTHDAGGLTDLDFRVAQAARAATNPGGSPLTCAAME
jgi:4a-hydroxytetrahydrobiopterin dehydratase